MISKICLCLLCGVPPARAASLETVFARRLMHARRSIDLERLRAQFDHARIARLTCHLQVARGTAPIECYEVLATERAWRVLDEATYRRRRFQLDAACARATLNQRVPDAGTSLAHVSRACGSRVKQVRLDLAYRRGDRGWSED